MSTAIKERPILFSGEMVRAILDGRKGQTRRVIKPQPTIPEEFLSWCRWADEWATTDTRMPEEERTVIDEWTCPYGKPGDRLWVRETWAPIPESRPSGYFSNPELIDKNFWYRASDSLPTWGGKWKPSIHMPRAASRITLEVTDVRVERVQHISEADAAAEGVDAIPSAPAALTHRTSFAKLWDTINSKRGHPWSNNDWVWAVSFKRIANS